MILLKCLVVMKMNLNITGTTLDIILLVVLILSILIGWKNGLVDSLISFVLSVVVIGISWFMSKPIATLITLPEMALETELIAFVGPVLQRAIAFLGLFIVLIIAKNIIYMLIKPIISKIIELIKIVDTIDSICGAIFNVAKNVIIASILLACLNMPFFTNGSEILESSKGATIVMKVSPSISDRLLDFGETIVDFTQVETWANEDFTAKNMVYLLDTMNSCDVLTEENLNTFYSNYSWQIASLPYATVSEDEYNELIEMIEELPASNDLKNVLKNKLMY